MYHMYMLYSMQNFMADSMYWYMLACRNTICMASSPVYMHGAVACMLAARMYVCTSKILCALSLQRSVDQEIVGNCRILSSICVPIYSQQSAASSDLAAASFLHDFVGEEPHIPTQPPPSTLMASSVSMESSITNVYSSTLASTESGKACSVGRTREGEFALEYVEEKAPDNPSSEDDLISGLPHFSPSYILRQVSLSKQDVSSPGISNANAFEVAPPEALLQASEPLAPPQPPSHSNKKRKTNADEADRSCTGAEVPAKKVTSSAKTADSCSPRDDYLGGKANVLRATLQILLDKSEQNDDFAREMVKFLGRGELADVHGKQHVVSFLCFVDMVCVPSKCVCGLACVRVYVRTCMCLRGNVFISSRTCVGVDA
jgi:hypothetical protein